MLSSGRRHLQRSCMKRVKLRHKATLPLLPRLGHAEQHSANPTRTWRCGRYGHWVASFTVPLFKATGGFPSLYNLNARRISPLIPCPAPVCLMAKHNASLIPQPPHDSSTSSNPKPSRGRKHSCLQTWGFWSSCSCSANLRCPSQS